MSNKIIPQRGEVSQNIKIHPMTLRPRFLAIFAGRKMYSQRKRKMAIKPIIIEMEFSVIY
jgi:hypothetical protein